MLKLRIAGSLILAAAIVAPASAHHSFAMFDMSRNIAMTGTVKEFRWSMPHVWRTC